MIELWTHLLEAAKQTNRGDVLPPAIQEQIRTWNPDKNKVHDWRNHIPASIARVWDLLSLETRLVAFIMAEEDSSNEEWD